MEIDKALKEIEKIIQDLDPIFLYQSQLGNEIHGILRKVRLEKHEDVTKETRRV